MRVLFDTNVLIDFVAKRDPFSDDAEKSIALCVEQKFEIYIAAHTIPNMHYILRKHLTAEQRKEILLEMCRVFTVVGIDGVKLIAALENDDFSDYEDCLQYECAKDFGADYIVTRNVGDFKNSSVPAIEPSAFVLRFTVPEEK